MKYAFYKDFAPSLRSLFQKGGPFKKAAETVLAIKQKIHDNYEEREIFAVATTHKGEDRIPHCCKYELTGRARLVVVRNNNVCLFLFAGDHEATDKWLDRNRDIDFIAREHGGGRVVEPVHISPPDKKGAIARSDADLGAPDNFFDLIPERYRSRLFEGLPKNSLNALQPLNSMSSDEEILEAVASLSTASELHRNAILDVLVALRAGDAIEAKNRIDEFTGAAKLLADLGQDELHALISGERVVLAEDIDPAQFEHFVKTASYKDWMLYLHPSQREYVDSDYPGVQVQ